MTTGVALGTLYRPQLEIARELGIDVDTVLGQLGLTSAQLLDGQTRLTPDQGRMLARAVARALPASAPRDELGLRAAERFVTGDADLLGYIMAHSMHGLDAATALMQHARLIGDSADYRVETRGERVVIELGLLGGRGTEFPEGADFAVAVIFRLLLDATHGRTRPLAVHLPRPCPRVVRPFQRFFRTKVVFEAALPALEYERATMLVPLTQGDPRLVRILKKQAAAELELLRAAGSDDWQHRVRALIAQDLARADSDCSLAWAAARCGVSERTLRRRLSDAGTSYRSLVDDARKERALAMLAHEPSVTEVAHRLGFSDATAFARAFRRWTGHSPHAARRGLAGGVRARQP